LTQLKFSRDGNLIIAILNNNASTAESILWSTAHFVVNRSTAETSTNTTPNAAATTAVLMDNGNLALITAAESSSYNATSLWHNRCRASWRQARPEQGHRSKPPVHLKEEPDWSRPWLLDSDARTKGLLVPKYVNNHEEEYFTYESLDESSSTFVSIDVSGQIKLNIWSQEKHSWQTIYAQPADPCSLPAVCGPFTVCDGNSSPLFCSCMESFSPNSPLDWEAEKSNWRVRQKYSPRMHSQ